MLNQLEMRYRTKAHSKNSQKTLIACACSMQSGSKGVTRII